MWSRKGARPDRLSGEERAWTPSHLGQRRGVLTQLWFWVVIGISADALFGQVALAARALGYFLCATVVALGLGLLAGNLINPGAGFAGGPSADAT